MTTTTKKTAKKTLAKKASRSALPPSADIITISCRDYIIASYDEFKDREEDRALAEIMSERLRDGEPHLTLEEFEKRIGQKRKGRKK